MQKSLEGEDFTPVRYQGGVLIAFVRQRRSNRPADKPTHPRGASTRRADAARSRTRRGAARSDRRAAVPRPGPAARMRRAVRRPTRRARGVAEATRCRPSRAALPTARSKYRPSACPASRQSAPTRASCSSSSTAGRCTARLLRRALRGRRRPARECGSRKPLATLARLSRPAPVPGTPTPGRSRSRRAAPRRARDRRRSALDAREPHSNERPVQFSQHRVLVCPQHLAVELIGVAQRGEPRLRCAVGEQPSRAFAAREFRHSLDVDVERVSEETTHRAIGRHATALEGRSVKGIHADEVATRRGAGAHQDFEVRAVAKAPVAGAAHAVEVRPESREAAVAEFLAKAQRSARRRDQDLSHAALLGTAREREFEFVDTRLEVPRQAGDDDATRRRTGKHELALANTASFIRDAQTSVPLPARMPQL